MAEPSHSTHPSTSLPGGHGLTASSRKARVAEAATAATATASAAVAVGLGVGVALAVPDALPDSEGDAPRVRDAVGLADAATLSLRVVEGVAGGVGVGGVVGVVSSFRLVPVAAVFTSVAFVGVLKRSVIVSFASAVVSRVTSTVTVFCVSPGAKVSVPEEAV